jgi:hypothetical protein
MRSEQRLESASRLPDEVLCAELARLAGSERSATASMIAHLVEFDARRLHLSAGFRSLFRYCTDRLRLSEHAAYNRIEAVHVVRRFPQILDRIEEGSLNLTTARLLAPHLTDGNQEKLLAGAAYKTKTEVQELIARHFPRPAVPSTIRKLPTTTQPKTDALLKAMPVPIVAAPMADERQPATAETSDARNGKEQSSGALVVANEPIVLVPPARPGVVRPLAADRFEVRFTATAETCEKLRLAKDLLRHAVPSGDLSEIVDRALSLLLEDLARKKFAAVRRGRDRGRGHEHAPAPVADAGAGLEDSDVGRRQTRHLPAAVKRAVWLRDGDRCAFVGTKGRRCDARAFLEFHHLDPHAVGGGATEDNIELRCRAHNAYEADLFYGQREPTSVLTGRDRARARRQLL